MGDQVRVDFYQLSQDSAEAVATLLARNAMLAEQRLLIVSQDSAQLDRISKSLWARADSFLAHGRAGEPDEPRQPILLSGQMQATNRATFVLLADGVWREAEDFDRLFLVFGEDRLQAARDCWRELGNRDTVERHFWKQDGKQWIEAG